MAGLDRGWRLVVVGDGPLRRGLRAHAADLLVSSRIDFVGAVSDSDLYRWLRTARVLVALGDCPASGLQVLEALAAGLPVVATDNAVHREAIGHVGDAGVEFVAAGASPLTLADAIRHAPNNGVAVGGQLKLPTWDELVERTLDLYERAVEDAPRPLDTANGNGTVDAPGVAGDLPSLSARS
jgi:glycosyltransferase involved in cell wall biosynthesis